MKPAEALDRERRCADQTDALIRGWAGEIVECLLEAGIDEGLFTCDYIVGEICDRWRDLVHDLIDRRHHTPISAARDALAVTRANRHEAAVVIDDMTDAEVRYALAALAGFCRGLIMTAAADRGVTTAALYDRWAKSLDEEQARGGM